MENECYVKSGNKHGEWKKQPEQSEQDSVHVEEIPDERLISLVNVYGDECEKQPEQSEQDSVHVEEIPDERLISLVNVYGDECEKQPEQSEQDSVHVEEIPDERLISLVNVYGDECEKQPEQSEQDSVHVEEIPDERLISLVNVYGDECEKQPEQSEQDSVHVEEIPDERLISLVNVYGDECEKQPEQSEQDSVHVEEIPDERLISLVNVYGDECEKQPEQSEGSLVIPTVKRKPADIKDDKMPDQSSQQEQDKNGLTALPVNRNSENAKDSKSANLLRLSQAKDQSSNMKLAKKFMSENELAYLDTGDVLTDLYRFNGCYWELMDEQKLHDEIYDMLDYSYLESIKNIEPLLSNVAAFVINETGKKFRQHDGLRFTEADYSEIRNRIVFRNLVYDCASGRIYDFDKNLPYRFQLNFDYYKKYHETPFYDQFRKDATMNDKASMRMFDDMLIYLLIPNMSGKAFYYMGNAKDSGKSTFGSVIESLFPKKLINKISVQHLGESRFSCGGITSATKLLTCFEIPKGRLSKAAANDIKTFTGEETMLVERKYSNERSIDVHFKVLLAGNGGINLPPGDNDDAFYRRAIVLPFIYGKPVGDLRDDLKTHLKQELPYIISNAAKTFSECIKEDGGIKIQVSQMSKSLKGQWTGANSIAESFISESLSHGTQQDRITKSELYAKYDAYFNSVSTKYDIELNQNQLIDLIVASLGAEKSRQRFGENKEPHYCLTGVKWKSQDNEWPDNDWQVNDWP